MSGNGGMTARELLILARSTANAFREGTTTPTLRLGLCKQLLAEFPTNRTLNDFADAISALDDGSRHYWIGTFYSLLMPTAERRSRAAYFTPSIFTGAMAGMLPANCFGSRFTPLLSITRR